MFDSLSDRLQDIIRKTSGNDKLSDDNISDTLREIRRALLEADVSLRVVKSFISKIKDKVAGEEVTKSVTPGQQLVKIVYDELAELMGGSNTPMSNEGKPNIIMLFGLQGSGKTTTAGKLAIKLRKENRNPLLVAADVYRPAAIKQLQTIGKQINIPVFTIDNSSDVRSIVSSAVVHAKENGFNTLIVDTAGRLQIDNELMAELVILERLFEPAEKLLVIDAMTGQESINVAESFNEHLDVTGVILSKLDGDARGGAALSIAHATGKPIKFIGMGEKLDALEAFYPDRMAQRILGMGDIVSLVEKAQENFDIESAKELEKKMRKSEFSLEDFMKIQKQMKSLGSMDQILGMLPIPGLNKDARQEIAHVGETQLKRIEACIHSMTPEERRKPEIIKSSRKKRIAGGCGLPIDEINRFLKEFDNMRKMMKQMADMTSTMRKNPKKMSNMMNMPGGLGALKGKFPPFK